MSLQLDGTNSLSTTSPTLTGGIGPITISCVVRFNSGSLGSFIELLRYNANGTTEKIALSKQTDNDFVVAVNNGTNGGSSEISAMDTADVWYRCVGTFSGSTNLTPTAYMDGTSASAGVARLIDEIDRLGIGAHPDGGNELDGDIAEIGIWDRVLDGGERIMLHGLTCSPNCIPNGLVHYYPMIDDHVDVISGQTLTENGTIAFTDHPPMIYPADLTAGMIAHYGLAEPDADVRPDSFGDNHLFLEGSVSQATGKIGNGASFPNTGGSVLYHERNAAFNSARYISVWVNLDTKSTDQHIYGAWSSGHEHVSLRYNQTDDRFEFRVRNSANDDTGVVQADTVGSPSTGTWYFIEAWHDVTGETLNIAVNAGTADSTAWTEGIYTAGTERINIGGIGGTSTSEPFDGVIDEVTVRSELPSSIVRSSIYRSGSGIDLDNANEHPNQTVMSTSLGSTTVALSEIAVKHQRPLEEMPFNPNRVNFQFSFATIDLSGTVWDAVTYYSETENLVIAVRSDEGAWTIYHYDGVSDSPNISRDSDDHNTAVVDFSSDGILHVSYNHHNDALNYRKSDAVMSSWDGTLTSELSMLGTDESSVTYPCFFRDRNDKLYFIYREGVSGGGDTYIRQYNTGTNAWENVSGLTAGLMVEGLASAPDVNLYHMMPVVDSQNRIHFCGHWRDTAVGTTNHDVVYWRFDVDSSAWEQRDGTSQTMPVTEANADYAVTGNANRWDASLRHGISFDSDDEPHILYDDNHTWKHVYSNGSAWTAGATWSPGGTDFSVIASSIFVVDPTDDTAYVYRVNRQDNRLEFITSSSPYSSWSSATTIYAHETTQAPHFNQYRWRDDKEIWFVATPQHVLVPAKLHSFAHSGRRRMRATRRSNRLLAKRWT